MVYAVYVFYNQLLLYRLLYFFASKPRDATGFRYGLKFADIHYKLASLRVAKLRKPGFKAIDIPARNRI